MSIITSHFSKISRFSLELELPIPSKILFVTLYFMWYGTNTHCFTGFCSRYSTLDIAHFSMNPLFLSIVFMQNELLEFPITAHLSSNIQDIFKTCEIIRLPAR